MFTRSLALIALFLLSTFLVTGCAAKTHTDSFSICTPSHPKGDIAIDSPVVIGLYDEQPRIESEPLGTFDEHWAHFVFALDDIKKCMGSDNVTIVIVCGNQVTIRIKDKAYTLKPNKMGRCKRDIRSFVFAAPGRTPVLKDSCGIVDAAALTGAYDYFNSPGCSPEVLWGDPAIDA